MRFSLLYKIEEPERVSTPQLAKDLLLERALKQIHTNERALRYFFEVLASPPQRVENADHRAQILNEFFTHRSLFDRLSTCLQVLDTLPDQYKTQRSILHTNARFGSDARFMTDEKLLMHSASTLLQLFDYLHQLLDILESYPLCAEPLIILADSIKRILRAPDFSSFSDLLERLSALPTDYRLELQFSLNERGRLEEYDLIRVDAVPTPPKLPNGLQKLILSREKKEEIERLILEHSPIPKGLQTAVSTTNLRNTTVGGVYERLTEQLNRIIMDLFDRYCKMSGELYFYQVALSIVTFYEKQEIPFCFAQFTAEKNTKITDLSDFVLLVESYGSFPVIPNDVELSETRKGILISGENSSGKTVYLRSIATAMLFSQNGLPLPASCASVGGYRNIHTLFSAAENPELAGSGAGRFEEEVAALSDIVDRIECGDVLFLNEIFQTTSYTEGAKGLCEILRYLAARDVRYVCVSHLTDLFHLLGSDEATKLSTTDPNGGTPYRLIEQQ